MSILNNHSHFNSFKTFSGNGEISLYNSASSYILDKKIKKMFVEKISFDYVEIKHKENILRKDYCVDFVLNRVEKIKDISVLKNLLNILETEGCQIFFLYLKDRKYNI
jgi:hypothetical protein